MANKAQAIEQYSFSPNDNLLLDTNVWLFIHCPHGDPNDYRVVSYSAALKRMLEAKSAIFVDATVLGEFVNRYARLAHSLLVEKGKAPEEFKRFRRTGLFKPVAKTIADAAGKIARQSQRISCRFDAFDIDRALSEYETGGIDFSDLVILDLCRERALTLVTDDADIISTGISVLTTKERL